MRKRTVEPEEDLLPDSREGGEGHGMQPFGVREGYNLNSWVLISESESCSVGLYSPWNSPGQDTGVGSRSLLRGIFPTQGSNSGLPHCGQILISGHCIFWLYSTLPTRQGWRGL